MEIKIQFFQFLHLAAAGAAERYFSIPSAFPFEFQLFHDPKSALNYKQLYFLLKGRPQTTRELLRRIENRNCENTRSVDIDLTNPPLH